MIVVAERRDNSPPAGKRSARYEASPARPADRRIVGWREWIALPALGLDRVKAKFDTGARTSALHAWDQEVYEVDGAPWIRFRAHPIQNNDTHVVDCAAPLADCRWVTNSGGTRERRNVIRTPIAIGSETWTIEITLTNRDEMGFRMLVGRQAMRGRLIVDPMRSYRTTRRKRKRATAEGRETGRSNRGTSR